MPISSQPERNSAFLWPKPPDEVVYRAVKADGKWHLKKILMLDFLLVDLSEAIHVVVAVAAVAVVAVAEVVDFYRVRRVFSNDVSEGDLSVVG